MKKLNETSSIPDVAAFCSQLDFFAKHMSFDSFVFSCDFSSGKIAGIKLKKGLLLLEFSLFCNSLQAFPRGREAVAQP